MDWAIDFTIPRLMVYLFVLARVGGMTLTAPLFSLPHTPIQIRALITLAAAAMIAPAQFAMATSACDSLSMVAIAFASELLIGVVLGLGVSIVLSAARLAGQLIAQASGLSMAEVFDPVVEGGVVAHGQFLHLFATAIYLLIGGHRLLMASLLDTFATLPLGRGMPPLQMTTVLSELTTESFSLALRAAAPVVVALLLATLSLGLIARAVPQWNVSSIGFGLNVTVSLAVLCASLCAIAWLFDDAIYRAIEALSDAFAPNNIAGH